MPSRTFDPNSATPSLAGKVLFITGGTAGLGAGSIAELAKRSPAHIFFSGRNQNSADGLIQSVAKVSPDVKLTFVKCDVSSLSSVKEAAETLKAQADRLDILMLNAGIMAVEPAVSEDGYEIQFATNYLGHALLVKLLLPLMLETARRPGADVRVINLTSVAYRQAPKTGIDFKTIKSDQRNVFRAIPGAKWYCYGQSKLAQMLYSQELAKHHPEITSVSIHPGFIFTGLITGLGLYDQLPIRLLALGRTIPVEQGHWNQCWAASCGKEQLKNGGYYEPVGLLGKRKTRQAKDESLAAELWSWTERELAAWS